MITNQQVLYIDVQEKSGIIPKIEKYPELFPNIDVRELGFHDPDTDEYIQCLDYTDNKGTFGIEHKIIHTLETDDYTGRYKEGDFHSSLVSGQLEDQLAKMRIYFKRNITLMCEGFLLNYGIWHPKLRNRAYSIVGKCAKNGIGFTECYNDEDFIEKLYWIMRKSESEPIARQDIKNEGRFVIPQLASVARIPLIGKHRAKVMFKQYGNLMTIIDNRDNLHELSTFGPGTETAFRDWLFDEVIIND